MQHIAIRIGRQNDTTPTVPEMGEVLPTLLEAPFCTIHEGATGNGKAAVNFIIKLPDGTFGMVQLTEGVFEAINSALQGAKQHWLENPVENIFNKREPEGEGHDLFD